ncbi:MAG TPA: hypothetical protein VMV86_04075 [Methanosarcinales archaeon]|nr:hypothetical protein [Methanosarcinales archaeon]
MAKGAAIGEFLEGGGGAGTFVPKLTVNVNVSGSGELEKNLQDAIGKTTNKTIKEWVIKTTGGGRTPATANE